MKILVLFLIIAISFQPVQAGFCGMDTGQDTSHHMKQGDDGGHKCCDSEQPESQTDCSTNLHCGFCSTSVMTIPIVHKFNVIREHHHFRKLASSTVALSHSTPPFRPPIS